MYILYVHCTLYIVIDIHPCEHALIGWQAYRGDQIHMYNVYTLYKDTVLHGHLQCLTNV